MYMRKRITSQGFFSAPKSRIVSQHSMDDANHKYYAPAAAGGNTFPPQAAPRMPVCLPPPALGVSAQPVPACMYVCVCVCMYACVCMCVCVYCERQLKFRNIHFILTSYIYMYIM
jgi:hypothetical protein